MAVTVDPWVPRARGGGADVDSGARIDGCRAALPLSPRQAAWAAALTVLFAIGLALPGVVFFSEPAQYTILHTILEFASMAISLMVVALAWNLRHLERNSQIMLIGWFSLGVLLVDLAHTLSFPGMPPLVTESTAQKAITFWLAGRIAAVVGFLLLALLPTRHWNAAAVAAWRRGRRRHLARRDLGGAVPDRVGAHLLRPG